MKRWVAIHKKLMCIFVIALVLCSCVNGAEEETEDWTSEVVEGQYDALDLDELYSGLDDDEIKLLDEINILDADFSGGIGTIFSSLGNKLGDIFKKAAGSAAIIMAIAIICSLVGSVYDDSGKAVPAYVNLAGVLAISAVVLGSSSSFLGLGSDTLDKLENLSKILLPALSTLAASAGAMTSASVKCMATLLFIDVLITISKQVLMPVIYAYIAVSIADAAFGGGSLKGAAGVLKWMANMMLTVIMISFVTYITIIGITASSADVVTTRVAKTVISTAIPVVGGIVSDAASSLVAGVSILKNAVGIFGVLAVVAVCIIPFLRLGASYLMYKLAAGLTEGISDSSLSRLVGSISSAFGMVMGLVGAGAMMMFFGILSLIKAVAI